MRRTNEQRSAITKAKLLGATIELLVEKGFEGTSVAGVSERAGVSKGAQLHHYPTRAALVSAAVEHLMAMRRIEFEAAMSGLPEGADRLDVALRELWTIYSGPTLGAWMELVVASRTDPALREAVCGVNRRFALDAETALKRVFGVEDSPLVPAAARMVMALFDGLATTHFIDDDETQLTATIELFKRLIGPWRRGQLGGSP